MEGQATENIKTQGQGQRAGGKAGQQRSQRISHEWFHTDEYSNKDQQQLFDNSHIDHGIKQAQRVRQS